MSKDRFSEASDSYQRFRPRYPDELFTAIAERVPARDLLWDCGCGSGQASLSASHAFQTVIGTDLSWQQLGQASGRANLVYAAARAEAPPLAACSVDVILVAQALHWFDGEAFFAAADRVLKPGGLLVALTYNLLSISPAVDAVIEELYYTMLQGYWDAERRHVERGYRDIDFPYTPESFPDFAMQANWEVEHLLGYLRTWSGVRQYQKATGRDPVAETEAALRTAWPGGVQSVQWPLSCIVRRKG